MSPTHSWWIACLATMLICSCTGLEVTAPESIANTVFNAPRYRWVGPEDWSFDVTGRLVDERDTDLVERIVLVGYTPAREKSQKIESLWHKNVSAIVLVPDSAPVDLTGLNNYARVTLQYNVLVPTVMISNTTWQKLRTWLDDGLNVTVRVTSADVNSWDLMMHSEAMVVYSVFLSAFTAACIGLAVYKLVMFVRAKGCQESIPQTMLIFEIIANTLRLFPCAVDPLQSRTLLPYLAIQLFYTISWPFVIINLLLISFYWHELMKKSAMTMNTFLAKLRIPFWIIFALLLALDLTQSLLRGLLFELKTFLTIIGVVYIVFGLLCVIFYIYTGTKLTRTMTKISKKMVSSNRLERLKKTSRFIYASAGGVIVWLIAIAVGGLTDAFWIPWGFFSVWLIGFTSVTFISLMQILAIHEPNSLCGVVRSSTDVSLSKPGQNGSSLNGSVRASCTALQVLSPPEVAGRTFNSPRSLYVGPIPWSFDVTGELVNDTATDVTNKIVLFSFHYPATTRLDAVKVLWESGALGIVMVTDPSLVNITGSSNYALGDVQRDIMLPSVIISEVTRQILLDWLVQGMNVTVQITSDEQNEWDLMMDSDAMIFYSVFLSAFSAGCLGLAIYKLSMFVKAKGCQQSIPQTMLIFEIITNTVRLIPCAIDPLLSRQIFPFRFGAFFFTMSWPFLMINLLLLSFYWQELMVKSKVHINATFLKKMKIPFWVIFGILLAVEVNSNIIRGFGFNPATSVLIISGFYLLLGLGCVIYYVVTGTKLVLSLGQANESLVSNSRAQRLQRTSKFIYVVAAAVFCWLVVISLSLTDIFWLPWGYYGIWFSQFFIITFISLMQQLAIQEPNSACSVASSQRSTGRSGKSNKESGFNSTKETSVTGATSNTLITQEV